MTETFSLSTGMVLTGESHGPEGGPLVLLLHGGGQSRRSWSSMAAKLGREGFRAVALDLRGHGDSAWADDGDYDLDRYVEDLSEVIGRLGGHAAMIGASLGGLCSLALAGKRPELVDAVLLADVTPRNSGGGVDTISTFLRTTSEGFASPAEAAKRLSTELGTKRSGDGSRLIDYLKLRDDGRYYWKWDPRVAEPRHIGHLSNHPPLMALTASIRAPLLLVRAPKSSVVQDEDVAFFRDLVPHMRVFETRPDLNHMVTGENNERFGDPMVDFLREVVAPSRTGAAA